MWLEICKLKSKFNFKFVNKINQFGKRTNLSRKIIFPSPISAPLRLSFSFLTLIILKCSEIVERKRMKGEMEIGRWKFRVLLFIYFILFFYLIPAFPFRSSPSSVIFIMSKKTLLAIWFRSISGIWLNNFQIFYQQSSQRNFPSASFVFY